MNLAEFIGLTLFGGGIGILSGFFGIGGGAFLVPLLVRFGGLPWDQAIALSLAQMIPTGALGAWRRWRQGEVHLKLALISLGGSIPGAALGRWMVGLLGRGGDVSVGSLSISVIDTALSLIFSFFLIWMGMRMWRSSALKPLEAGALEMTPAVLPDLANGDDASSPTVPPFEAWLLGAAVGTTSALLGIGGGFLFVPVAVQRFGFPVTLAVGTSLMQIPVTAAVGAALYLSVPGTPFLWLVPLLIGSLIGVVQGVALSKRFDNQQLKRFLAVLLLGVAFLVLGSWIRSLD